MNRLAKKLLSHIEREELKSLQLDDYEMVKEGDILFFVLLDEQCFLDLVTETDGSGDFKSDSYCFEDKEMTKDKNHPGLLIAKGYLIQDAKLKQECYAFITAQNI